MISPPSIGISLDHHCAIEYSMIRGIRTLASSPDTTTNTKMRLHAKITHDSPIQRVQHHDSSQFIGASQGAFGKVQRDLFRAV